MYKLKQVIDNFLDSIEDGFAECHYSYLQWTYIFNPPITKIGCGKDLKLPRAKWQYWHYVFFLDLGNFL